MGKYSEALLNERPEQPEQPEQPSSYARQLLSAALESQNVQEGRGTFSGSFSAGMFRDPQRRLQAFAQDMFPDDPEAVRRFGYVDGKPVFVNDQGQLQQVQGGAASFFGGVASDIPEIAGSIAGSIAGTPTGQPILGAALGASIGESLKTAVAGTLLDEPQSVSGNLTEQAKEIGLAGGGEFAGQRVGAFINRKLLGAPITEAATQSADSTMQRLARETGIELDLAQVTNNPVLKAMKKWAAKYPSQASETLQAFDEVQAGQAEQAIQRIINTLAETPDSAILGNQAVNASKAIIESLKMERAQLVDPLYRQAFQGAAPVNIEGALSLVESFAGVAKGKALRQLRYVRDLLTDEAGDPENSLEILHRAKQEIADMFERDLLGNTTRREVTQIDQELIQAMAEASPEYARASQAFADFTTSRLDPIQNSVIGEISRLSDSRAAVAAARIFQGTAQSPQAFNRAKNAFRALGPEGLKAWDGIVAQWMGQNLDRAMQESAVGATANMAGRFRKAVFGRPSQRTALQLALQHNKPMLQAFDSTMEAFEMLSRTPISGSDTYFNQIVGRTMGAEAVSQMPTLVGHGAGRDNRQFSSV